MTDWPEGLLGEATFRYVQNQIWAILRESEGPGIVCEKCLTEQPHWRGSRCVRGALLGLPCDGIYAVTGESWIAGDWE